MPDLTNSSTKILVVDDEENMRSLLSHHLREEHYDCVTAQNAFDALNKLKRDHFSLVISDLSMPGMTGMELLRLIKKLDPEISVIMITGITDVTTAVDCLRIGACDYITKPFDLPAVRRAVERALERRQLMIENRYDEEELEKIVLERTLDLNGALHDVEDSYRITLEALVTALDAREHETQAHSQRVREYTWTLARELGFGGESLVHIGRGALLHDVGKIGVPDSILLKPGRLTAQEWVEMKKHPEIGYDILREIRFLAPAAEIVLAHQERWDGRGYPNQLGRRDIPVGARIFAVVDTLDAMTSNRPYRRAMSFSVAREEIQRCSGTQFDPEVVEAFLSLDPQTWIRIHDSINQKYQNLEASKVLCRT
jgi:putative nucleotidyltransferase with HDIG domain